MDNEKLNQGLKMKLDYKDWIQNRAEELALGLFPDCEWYDLSGRFQDWCYAVATEDYKDHLADQIDATYERLRMMQ